jgi:hypothetical protein
MQIFLKCEFMVKKLRKGNADYSASTYKEPTDAGGFFTTSFGRIFCSAKKQAFRGFRVSKRGVCVANSRSKSAKRIYDPLQSFAQRHPFGVNTIRMEFCNIKLSRNCRNAAIPQSPEAH